MIILWCYVPAESSECIQSVFEQLEEQGHGVFVLATPAGNLEDYKIPDAVYALKGQNILAPSELKKKWIPRITATKWSGQPESIYLQLESNAKIILSTLKPSIVVAWNALAPTFGILADIAAANGVKVVHSERGLIPKSIYIDESGPLNFSSKLSQSVQDIDRKLDHDSRHKGERIFEQLQHSSTVRHYHDPRFRRNLEKTLRNSNFELIMVIFGAPFAEIGYAGESVHKNEGIFPLFSSYNHLLGFLSAHFPNMLWLFKPHPHGRLPDIEARDNLLVTNADPGYLIGVSSACLFHGSKLEIEAVVRGKAVILLGYGEMWNKGVCYDVGDQEDLTKVILKVLNGERGPQGFQENLIKFLGWLSDEYLYFADPAVNVPPHMERDDLEARLIAQFPSDNRISFVPYSLVYAQREELKKLMRAVRRVKKLMRFLKKIWFTPFRRLRRLSSRSFV